MSLRALMQPRNLVRFAATLALGGFGGWIFVLLQLPLPWMLGSMTAVTLGTLIRLPLHAPMVIRPPVTAVIGVLLGAAFHPGLMQQLPLWLPTLAGLLVFTVVAGGACTIYLHRVIGFDRTTAFFAGMPGGLIEMVTLGAERGGDELKIALMHSARILMVVFALPFVVQMIEGVSLSGSPSPGLSVTEAPLSTFALLIGTAVLGLVLGKRLRLPAATLLGPMLLSAGLHATGVTDFVPPQEIVWGAQLILGAIVGCRFSRATPAEVLRIIVIAAGMTVILLITVIAMAAGVSALTGQDMVTLILAYSPGGLTEMGLVALAIHADVAFVASHHLIRVILVMVCAAPAFRLLGRWTKNEPK